jgi:hypothetical protein
MCEDSETVNNSEMVGNGINQDKFEKKALCMYTDILLLLKKCYT